MKLLILGLVLFLGAHTFTTLRQARAALIARFGEGVYKIAYSVVAILGFVLIAKGFGSYRAERLHSGLGATDGVSSHRAPADVARAHRPGRCLPAGAIKRRLKHPMLVAVKIWALAHLLANGDLGSMILFGSLLAWAVFDRIAVKKRERVEPRAAEPGSTRGDIIAVVLGTIVYVAMIFLHPFLIGVKVMGWACIRPASPWHDKAGSPC